MPKQTEENNDIKIREEESSLAEFTKRPIPTEEEVEEFEEYVEEEVKDEEIEESLNEIYQDDDGEMVNVKKLTILKKHGFLFWFFSFIIIFGILGGSAYYIYNYMYLKSGSDVTAIEFKIESRSEVTAGEEFFYNINYKNNSNTNIKDIKIKASFPDNFIILDSYPEAINDKNDEWKIDLLSSYRNGSIKIKGMIIDKESEISIVTAEMIYTPANFSSEFKKSFSYTTSVHDTGLDIEVDHLSTVLLKEENEILVRFAGQDNNYIKNFRVSLEIKENFELIEWSGEDLKDEIADFAVVDSGVWDVKEVLNEDRILPIKIKFNEKLEEKEELVFVFESINEEKESLIFHEETIFLEVLKSDLNLTLIINGSRDDQGVNFGDKLNYSIVYNNKGETALKDVVVMAVLESDFLDRTTLEDQLSGIEKGSTITWSKEEIPELEIINENEEGIIDFSINISEFSAIEIGKDYEVKSFVQYRVGESETGEVSENEDNRSNTITNKLNSDLRILETIRYFDEDNIPVGTGPHPPKVGETTSYKVYWNIENNLHELNDLKVTVMLPEYVLWNNKERATIGNMAYNSSLNAVIWDIGRLPITVYQGSAEFSVSVTPNEDDKNKIMVLLPGSEMVAEDAETEAEIKKNTKAKTTRLEDDEIAEGDGIVE